MNQKLIKQTSSVLHLINIFDFVQPKLKSFADIATGQAFQQILINILEIDIQQEYSDNWEMQMKNLKELWHLFESKINIINQTKFSLDSKKSK